jgi:hypothetical protein
MLQEIDNAINNYNNQIYQNMEFIVVVDKTISGKIGDYILNKLPVAKIIPYEIFNSRHTRLKTRGKVLNFVLRSNNMYDYFICMGSSEIWHYDHITSMVRTLEDNKEAIASYSGRLFRNDDGSSEVEFWDVYTLEMLYYAGCHIIPTPGQFLLSKDVEEYTDDFVFDYLDGNEIYVYVLFGIIRGEKNIYFTKRMTFSHYDNKIEKVCRVVDPELSIRFIQDIIRYDIVEKKSLSSASEDNIKRKLLLFPLKSFIFFRVVNVVYFIMSKFSGNHSKLSRLHRFAQKRFMRRLEDI